MTPFQSVVGKDNFGFVSRNTPYSHLSSPYHAQKWNFTGCYTIVLSCSPSRMRNLALTSPTGTMKDSRPPENYFLMRYTITKSLLFGRASASHINATVVILSRRTLRCMFHGSGTLVATFSPSRSHQQSSPLHTLIIPLARFCRPLGLVIFF